MERIYEFLSNNFYLFKTVHVIAVISWIASIMYLLRIFVYHSRPNLSQDTYQIFSVMEKRVIKYIMNFSMITVYISGISIAYVFGFVALGHWFYIKMLAVLVLTLIHFFSIHLKNEFQEKRSVRSTKFYRILNEIPTLLMIVAVSMVIMKPFE